LEGANATAELIRVALRIIDTAFILCLS
jgi:hypothetical protein